MAVYEDMSIEELEKLLTRKERLFVEEYDRDGNGTQAAIRAGYNPGKKNASASVQASKLLRSAKISAYRRARANELCRQLGISQETIRLNVMDVYRRCMTAKPVMKYDPDSREWVESGEYVFDSKGALKAMELLGKPLGDILGVYFGQAAEYSGYLNLNAPNMYALIPHGAEVNTALAARLGILAAFALAAAVLAALLVFRRQADDRALLAAAVVLAIGVPFLLPHMHERYFFLADVLALAWACAFPRSAPCALLVELASLGAYVVVLRGKFTLAVSLDGRLFPMLCEALLMLAGLAFAVLSLARRLAFPQKSRE